MAYLTGLVRTGPKKGKTLTSDKRRIDDAEGFYVYRGPRGPVPGEWVWIPNKLAEAPK